MGSIPVNLSRKEFIRLAAGALPLGAVLLSSCKEARYDKIGGSIIGATSSRGHLLRESSFETPHVIHEKDVLIIGGGVAGLSAARYLKKAGVKDFAVFELSEQPGGNAVSGKNEVSAYPWGAHYLPVPDHRDHHLLEFLKECGAIEGYNSKGLPLYNELYLCFDPEERLHINGYWQEGLVPHFGVPENEQKQIASFFARIEMYKKAIGTDGKDAFCIPLKNASKDEKFVALDKISMQDYMQREGFDSNYLHWYIDYCCRDDYGTNINETSAWAGIHYFASRKGVAGNTDSSTVLTWPEGNAWLVNQMREQVAEHIQTDMIAYSVDINDENEVIVDCYNFRTKQTERVICNKIILATPQFVNKRLLKENVQREETSYKPFTYAPWMVANITTPISDDGKGLSLCWDNVFFGSKSLGYVDATHQHVKLFSEKKVLTYYLPLADKDPKEERMSAYEMQHKDWVRVIMDDMEKVHPGIHKNIETIDVWLWGHGMIRPVKNFISGTERPLMAEPIRERIFFAHSDLSGISIFEEAFHQGIDAADNLVKSI